jgi:hypothetical protein
LIAFAFEITPPKTRCIWLHYETHSAPASAWQTEHPAAARQPAAELQEHLDTQTQTEMAGTTQLNARQGEVALDVPKKVPQPTGC